MNTSPGNNTPYVIDVEQTTEAARLVEQSKLFTTAMGGSFPDELDLSSVKKVLDLGGGPGEWANEVACDYPGMDVVGVDINESMIKYATSFALGRGRPNISFEIMDIRRPLDFHDASFDVIHARFMVGFQDKASWPHLLAECRRVLAPGGILLLSEAEQGISSSPALQQLQGWLSRALSEQGRTFSVDGQTIGIVHMLGQLLRQTGFVAIEQRPFLLDASFGSPLYASSLWEFETTYKLLRPYLVDAAVVDTIPYDRAYYRMLGETRLDTFRCVAFGMSAWGSKPSREGSSDEE